MHEPTSAHSTPETDRHIGDETFSAIKWLASHWGDLGPWIAIGIGAGGGTVLTLIGAPVAAGEQLPKWLGLLIVAIGPLMVTLAWIGVYFARQRYMKQEDSKRRRHRAEKHEEMLAAPEDKQAGNVADMPALIAGLMEVGQEANDLVRKTREEYTRGPNIDLASLDEARYSPSDMGAAPFGRLTISDGGELVHQG